MNFFQRQHQAKRKTFWLVALFLLATLCIIVVMNCLALYFIGGRPEQTGSGWLAGNAGLLIGVSLVTALTILGASAYKIAALNEGGGAVARNLGATPVPPEPTDFPRQQLRNVVEEIAIASGMPVPEIYVLEQESAINAFAAGSTPADAAIAVTRGAMERLERDELQGVIAHEFSHVANGDMRLNLKLMGWVFGILILALAGRMMLYSGGRSKEGKSLAMVGLGLIAVGYLGLFFGRMIKAAVSRERERLADASAVQFTRDSTGLAGALKKIGGFEAGSKLTSTDAEQVSHMLFASSLSGWFASLYATHPPLAERIRALQPSFDPGRAERSASAPASPAAPRGAAPQFMGLAPAAAVASVGRPGATHLQAGQFLHRQLPESLRAAARDEYHAPLLVMAAVLDNDDGVRQRQLAALRADMDERDCEEIAKWSQAVRKLGVDARLPILELTWPALKATPREHLRQLNRRVSELARADQRISVFEYAVGRMLSVLISDLHGGAANGRLKLHRVNPELVVLFSVMAAVGHEDEAEAKRAYVAGMTNMPGFKPQSLELPSDTFAALDRALDKLNRLRPLAKEVLVESLAITCAHDGMLNLREMELLRAVCGSLHCPMPPLPLN